MERRHGSILCAALAASKGQIELADVTLSSDAIRKINPGSRDRPRQSPEERLASKEQRLARSSCDLGSMPHGGRRLLFPYFKSFLT